MQKHNIFQILFGSRSIELPSNHGVVDRTTTAAASITVLESITIALGFPGLGSAIGLLCTTLVNGFRNRESNSEATTKTFEYK